jgi:hypothetical protein
MTKLPPDYIDSNICGQNRKILECYCTAERSDGGTADEVILRGLLAVLAQFGGCDTKPAQDDTNKSLQSLLRPRH